MKKFAFAALALLAALPAAQAVCNFTNQTDNSIRAVVAAGGGWPVSDQKCAILNARNLILVVDSHATVLDGASVAWVDVMLMDKNLNIRSDLYQVSTYVNTKQAGMDVAKNMQYDAIKDAVNGLDFDKAAREIDGYRAKLAGKPAAKR